MARRAIAAVLCTLSMLILFAAPVAWGQQTQGTITITVLDPDGRVVPGAQLELQDLRTNDIRKAATTDSGTYSFINLLIGTYKLSVAKAGFRNQTVNSVLVEATKTTDLEVKLKLGAPTETVEVTAAAPVVEATSSAIGTTVNLQQIEVLPLSGRSLAGLATLTAGYNGTWNGLPSIAQGNNIDGVIGSPTRMKYGGNANPVATARVEAIEEMVVQTDSLDLNQGFGQATMQVNYVTRRGTNAYHGRVFEDFRNDALNANSWRNNALGVRKNKVILNEFGGAVGGPILRDKLFFFANFSMSKRPGTSNQTNTVFTPAAQAGDFTYMGTDGLRHTVNVLTLAQAYNTANPTATPLPTVVNGVVSAQFTAINKAVSLGTLSNLSDLNIQTLTWQMATPDNYYYPTVRLDYNLSEAVRMNVAFNQTQRIYPSNSGWPLFPGDDFQFQHAGYQTKSFTAAYGLDWTLSPTLINQFKLGFLYNAQKFGYNAEKAYETHPTIFWQYSNVNNVANANMSGQVYYLPTTNYYPVINASDTMTWQKAAHRFSFGFSFYRENDHYGNPPAGFQNQRLALDTFDPARNAFTIGTGGTLPAANTTLQSTAWQLYAILAGRLSGIDGEFPYDIKTKQYADQCCGAYNLNEISRALGLFFQDSYRLRPNLTVNYGLRWDFTGDNWDKTMGYHSAYPDAIYGPTASGDLFTPGALNGNLNPKLIAHSHVYKPWKVSPQPAIGFAWSPKFQEGLLAKLFGNDSTVVRGGFMLRNFTEPYQYYWDVASDYGAFFYQRFRLDPNSSGRVGTYTPGSLELGDSLPPFNLLPAAYQPEALESDFTFKGGVGINGMNPNIRQPYTESWNFGIQRKLGESRALEIRYNGNRTLHQWIAINPNEVNIFENGFLDEFKKAQSNLALFVAANPNCGTSGQPACNFANTGLQGQVPLPIIQAAFAGEPLSAGVARDFTSNTFLNYLRYGQVGTFANRLAGQGTVSGVLAPYFCNLVGASFGPCATNLGYTGAGAGKPINFFQANPYATGTGSGSSTGYMTDLGYSSYNALQMEFRQRPWHGLQFNANYTYSKTLGMSTPDDWTAAFTAYTLRNLRMSYAPTRFDLRHVFRWFGSYDLPVGKDKAFVNRGGVVNHLLGGWTVGTIVTRQSGAPFRLTGGYATYNNYADTGIVLSGLTVKQLQDAVGVYHITPAQNNGNKVDWVDFIDPKLLSSVGGGASSTYFARNTAPGEFGQIVYLWGPGGFYQDLSLAKNFRITEQVRFKFQSEFLNVWNHPVWTYNTATAGIDSTSFGRTTSVNGPRNIEFRANIEF